MIDCDRSPTKAEQKRQGSVEVSEGCFELMCIKPGSCAVYAGSGGLHVQKCKVDMSPSCGMCTRVYDVW